MNQKKFSLRIDEFVKELSSKSIELERVRAENNSLDAKFQDLQEVAKHKETVLENQREHLQTEVSKLRAEKVVMQERIRALLDENNDLKLKVAENCLRNS